MQKVPPLGSPIGTVHANPVVGTGTPGTPLGAEFPNTFNDEADALIVGSGQTPDQGDLSQWLKAVQRIAAASTDVAFQAGWGVDGAGEDLAVQTYGALTAGRAFSIAGVEADIQAAPVGAALVIDVSLNGSTVFATPPQFADGSTTLTVGVLTTNPTPVNTGDLIELKVTQVGSTTPGQRLTATIVGGLPA